MMLRCLVLLVSALVAVQSALIHKRDIPVEVVYENSKETPAPIHYAVRNLHEKVQLSPEELKKEQVEQTSPSSELPASSTEPQEASPGPSPAPEAPAASTYVKNLDEKVQLSPEELGQALKHLPISEEVVSEVELEKSNSLEQSPTPLELVQRAQEIIVAGVSAIKEKVESEKEQPKPSASEWENLNKTLERFLDEQLRSVQLRQENPTTAAPVQNQNNQLINNIINGFSNLTAVFSQNFQQNNKPNGPEDEQQGGQQPGGFFQQFINQFQGGVNQVVTNLNNMNNNGGGQQSTVLGDTGVSSTTERQNFINNVVSSVQQFFQGGNNIGNPVQTTNLNQSDEGVSTTTPRGGPIQVFQNIGNQIGQIFGQNNNNNKPPGSEDEGTASSTSAPNFIQSIGQVFQGVFRPDNSQGGQGGQGGQAGIGGQGGNNPISVVNNQIQQLVDNNNNNNNGGVNPVESLQNALGGGGGASSEAPSTEKAKIDPEASSGSTAASTTTSKSEQKEIMETIE